MTSWWLPACLCPRYPGLFASRRMWNMYELSLKCLFHPSMSQYVMKEMFYGAWTWAWGLLLLVKPPFLSGISRNSGVVSVMYKQQGDSVPGVLHCYGAVSICGPHSGFSVPFPILLLCVLSLSACQWFLVTAPPPFTSLFSLSCRSGLDYIRCLVDFGRILFRSEAR